LFSEKSNYNPPSEDHVNILGGLFYCSVKSQIIIHQVKTMLIFWKILIVVKSWEI